MARNPRIEAILAAWWDWEHCEHSRRAEAKAQLDALLDDVIRGQPSLNREDVLDHFHGHYLEHRRTRLRNETLEDRMSPSEPEEPLPPHA